MVNVKLETHLDDIDSLDRPHADEFKKTMTDTLQVVEHAHLLQKIFVFCCTRARNYEGTTVVQKDNQLLINVRVQTPSHGVVGDETELVLRKQKVRYPKQSPSRVVRGTDFV
jgi:hypothetical protein